MRNSDAGCSDALFLEQPKAHEMTTKLIKVDIAFLFQLADMTVDSETPTQAYKKAITAYHTAHAAVASRYSRLASAKKPDGSPAYLLEAVAGLAEPRDGAKVFALWFSSTEDFSRDARLDLTVLSSRCIADAAFDLGIASKFAGARQMRKLETVEWADIL
jgi:hypothetical protein